MESFNRENRIGSDQCACNIVIMTVNVSDKRLMVVNATTGLVFSAWGLTASLSFLCNIILLSLCVALECTFPWLHPNATSSPEKKVAIRATSIPRAISVKQWETSVLCPHTSVLSFVLAITHSKKNRGFCYCGIHSKE